jgi:DNA-binding transcriptional regulator YbjK
MSGRGQHRHSPRRDEAKADTRRRVLAAAMEVFAREGYHAARMDRIAQAASVSKGALYFNEVVMQSLQSELPALADAASALSAPLLRSAGAADAGGAADR